MTDQNTIIGNTTVVVRTPTFSGTKLGVGAQVGGFGTAFGFEGTFEPGTGEKGYAFSVGKGSFSIGGEGQQGSGPSEYKPSISYDWFRGAGGGFELTHNNIKIKLGFGFTSNALPGGIPGDPGIQGYLSIETPALHELPQVIKDNFDQFLFDALQAESAKILEMIPQEYHSTVLQILQQADQTLGNALSRGSPYGG